MPVVFAPPLVPAVSAAPCPDSRARMLRGVVHDSTGALIPGAVLQLDGRAATSGADGGFRFECVVPGRHTLTAHAAGFENQSRTLPGLPRDAVDVTLVPAAVQTAVEVTADSPGLDMPKQTIAGKDLESLADDPDDLLQELQQLGAQSGGSPANTVVAVDGFQGSSKLPPKSSIAYIELEPDLYSAEYQTPPYSGGRVNLYTKPGQSAFHGALFATNGSPWENARDPFSNSKAALGKQRYGFELTGPVQRRGADFALDLEHREIDDFAVVNAVTLDATGTEVPLVANVPTPQALWEGQARYDLQLGKRNTLVTTFTANVNSQRNVGVGGTSLAETGYNNQVFEHTLRFSELATVSPHFVHQALVSLRWDGESDAPAATAPQVSVAGSFTAGGSYLGPQRLREFNVEADDDAVLTLGKHNLKAGMQLMLFRERQQLTANFNGSYTFGGGSAPVLDGSGAPVPGETEVISGIEQYRRALLKLEGGTPTAFSNVSGTPEVRFTQVQPAFYVQDGWNVGHGLHLEGGLRYQFQNDPTTLNAITPRLGVLWAPPKRHYTLHVRAGLFATVFKETDEAEVLRSDGTDRVISTVYNPVFGSPFAGATPIHTIRRYSPHIANIGNGAGEIGGSLNFGHGLEMSVDLGHSRIWNDLRSVNVNAPLNGSPFGPRVLGVPNLNLLEMQNSAQDTVGVQEFDVEYSGWKRLHINAGVVRLSIHGDADNNHFFTPQSSFSNAGEFSQITSTPVWQMWGSTRVELPRAISFSTRMSGEGDDHYNLMTGFDNNGDGDFNDRPMLALPGTPEAVSTRYGLLVATGGAAVLRRNTGVFPWRYYVTSNLQKPFVLMHDAKKEPRQTLTVNVRSSNILNHTNVTAEGGVLGSPLFGVPYAADNGRRVEAGLRYSF